MRIVIIGAGAVGVTFGVSLEHMKHEVTYLVRKGRKRALRRMTLVHAVTQAARKRDAPVVLEHGDSLPPFEWALLCVRGDQIDGALETLAQHVRPDAKVGLAAASLDDLAKARAAHPQGPVFSITPSIAAWTEEDGVWRWFTPPLLKTLVSGEGDAAAQTAATEFAAALDAAGVPAWSVPSARQYAVPMLTSGATLIAGWELCHWDVDAFGRDHEMRKLTGSAMREAARAFRDDTPGPIIQLLAYAPGPALSLLIAALPRLTDAKTRAMWSHHGPKVGAQTRFMLDDMIARAGARGLETTNLRALRTRLA